VSKKNVVSKGQRWKNRTTRRVVEVVQRATGNRHWLVDNGHRIHEGTLEKFYERVR